MLEALDRQLAEQQAAFLALVPKIDFGPLDRTLKELTPQAARVGAAGWTIPMGASPAQVIEILRSAADENQLDDAFVSFYDAADQSAYIDLKRSLLNATKLARWLPLVEQSLTAYESDLNLVVVPAMLTVVDGALAELGGEDAWRKNNPQNAARRLRKQRRGDSFSHTIWTSIEAFVETVFATHSFGDAPPP